MEEKPPECKEREMQRGRERDEEDEKFQLHDRRLKSLQGENQEHDQPQKCPRCESINTKFCYYNNYSLSQPRYFCRGCRRYWTQGGTLRNVPVGGGYWRGKRPKISTSSTSASIEDLKNIIPSNVISSSPIIKNSFQPPKNIETGDLASPFFSSGDYFNQSFSFGHEMGSSANLSFSQGGFCVNHLFQSEQQKQRPIQSTQFYQMDEREKVIPSFYASLQNRPPPFAEAEVGNSAINSSSRSNNISSSISSFNPSEWSNIPGYDHDRPQNPPS